MKKLFSLLLAVCTFVPTMTTYASANESLEEASIVYTEECTPEYYLDRVSDKEPEIGDSYITQDAILAGLEYQERMNNSKTRASEEIYTMTSSSVYASYGIVNGKVERKVAAGVGDGSSRSFTLQISGVIKGVPIAVAVDLTANYTYSGPSGTEPVGSKYATHRYFGAMGAAQINKYVYKVTDKYTGNFIRNETKYLVSNAKVQEYGILGYYNLSTNKLTVRSISSNATKTLDEDDWYYYAESEYCEAYIDF